jgi:hypothetical protein
VNTLPGIICGDRMRVLRGAEMVGLEQSQVLVFIQYRYARSSAESDGAYTGIKLLILVNALAASLVESEVHEDQYVRIIWAIKMFGHLGCSKTATTSSTGE